MHPPPFSVGGGGGIETPTKVSKTGGGGGGGLTGPQLLEGGCWQRGRDFFQRGGGCDCHKK